MADAFPQEGNTPVDRAAGKGKNYLPTLDGWRALAILCVIPAHGQAFLPPTAQHIVDVAGYRAVEMFFALSGLLICGLLLREEERTGGIRLSDFYLRRLFRIQPAALTYLLFLAIAGLLGLVPTLWQGILGSILMVRNLWPHNEGLGAWFTGHYWSLSVEEHFYLLLPAFLVLVRRRRLALLGALFVLQILWAIQVRRHPALQTFRGNVDLRTDLRCGPILMGCIAALLLQQARWKQLAQRFFLPSLAIAYAVAVCWRLEVHHSTYDNVALCTVYPTLLVSTMLHPASLVSRALEWAPLRFVGRISFSLYLWQQFFFIWNQPAAPGSFRSHWFLCGCLTFVCATASYYLVELPMVRLGHQVAARRREQRAATI